VDRSAEIMPTVAFYTLGCKVNQYDTETLASLFRDEGFTVVPPDEQADVYVVNTCTVTGEGDHKSRHAVHRFHKLHPEALLAVTGCYAQVASQEIMDLEGVGIVAGTGRRLELARTAAAILSGMQTAPVNLVSPHLRGESFEETGAVSVPHRARAMVKVQEGCNQFCTYCRVPLARGRERSRQPDSVLAEIRALAEQGYQEIALTGIHLGAYGRDFEDGGNWDLARLVKAAAGVDGKFRISKLNRILVITYHTLRI
jgi:threonylcarbamoyladenosine tRNA methylthiotransferase MtaB